MIKGLQAQGSEGEIKRGNEAGKERLLQPWVPLHSDLQHEHVCSPSRGWECGGGGVLPGLQRTAS